MKFKHNKKRNTAFLFEALVKEMAKSVVSNDTERQGKIAKIIKRYFTKRGALYKDLQSYKVLMELKGAELDFARRIISEVRTDRNKLSAKTIFAEQSKLIKRINVELGADIYSNFVPNYKSMATIGQLFSDNISPNERVILEDKVLSEMTAPIEKTKEEILEHLDSIAYKTFTNKFNKAYAGKLHEEQQQVVSKYIYSVSDNGVSLKSYLNEEVSRLKERVTESLKMEEVTSDPNMVEKTQKVLEFLESLKDTKLDETVVKKVMQVQSLIREIESNE